MFSTVARFDFGVSEEMGVRPSMEDRTVVVQDLAVSALGPLGLGPQTFAAVFDGHGGTAASTFLWQKLHHNIATALRKGFPNIDAILGSLNVQLASQHQLKELDDYITALLKRVYVDTDREFVRTSKHPNAGSTCTSVLILGSRIYCANVGDSRTVSTWWLSTAVQTNDPDNSSLARFADDRSCAGTARLNRYRSTTRPPAKTRRRGSRELEALCCTSE